MASVRSTQLTALRSWLMRASSASCTDCSSWVRAAATAAALSRLCLRPAARASRHNRAGAVRAKGPRRLDRVAGCGYWQAVSSTWYNIEARACIPATEVVCSCTALPPSCLRGGGCRTDTCDVSGELAHVSSPLRQLLPLLLGLLDARAQLTTPPLALHCLLAALVPDLVHLQQAADSAAAVSRVCCPPPGLAPTKHPNTIRLVSTSMAVVWSTSSKMVRRASRSSDTATSLAQHRPEPKAKVRRACWGQAMPAGAACRLSWLR